MTDFTTTLFRVVHRKHISREFNISCDYSFYTYFCFVYLDLTSIHIFGYHFQGVVWGRAFQLSGEAALPYLNTRECVLGGYLTKIATFHPHSDRPLEPFPALVYIAVPGNLHWLGDAPLPDIASQIVSSSGPSGHNVEYLLRLAQFMREAIPEADDTHLFTLEFLVRTR